MHALQVYGNAVLDEAPVFFLTNYHVVIFFRRSDDVRDTRLWASSPIWFDQINVPARVYWVYALHQAMQLSSLKAKLPRELVPHTPVEQRTEVPDSPPMRKRQRTTREHASPPSTSADSLLREAAQTLLVQVHNNTNKEEDNQALSAIAKDVVPFSELGLTGQLELLERGRSGHVLKVTHTLSHPSNMVVMCSFIRLSAYYAQCLLRGQTGQS